MNTIIKKILYSLIPAALVALFFTSLLFLDQRQYRLIKDENHRSIYKTIDNRLFDLLLRLKKPIPEDPGLLLLEVDDQTITEVNKYPLPREVFSDGMILIAEFNPNWVMLDIEFVDKSEDGIDYNWKDNILADQIDQEIATLSEFQQQLVQLILDGKISRGQALAYQKDLEAAGGNTAANIKSSLQKITYSKDEYLSIALAYLGNVTATVNMINDKDDTIPDELRMWTEENFSINEYLTFKTDPFDNAVEILPSISPVLRSVKWAGFPRSYIDPDGTRRRIDPIYRQGDKYYTNLGFGTWWLREGMPPITVHPRYIETAGMKIPIDSRGKIFLNWPKRKYDGTPLNRKKAQNYDPSNPLHRLSFFYLYYHDILMADLSALIAELEQYNISSDTYGDTIAPLSTMENNLSTLQQEMIASGDGSRAGELGQYRDDFLSTALNFFTGDAEATVMSEINGVLSNSELNREDYTMYAELKDNVSYLFSEIPLLIKDIRAIREYLRSRLEGATIITGYTGTSTTDYGANPFEKQYMNMGIYHVLYNSLLQGQFLQEAPLWISLIVNFIAGFIAIILTNISKKSSAINTLLGGVFIVFTVILASLFFILSGIYIQIFPLTLTTLLIYLGILAKNYLTASKEKAFIQNAFGQIISPDIVKRIQDNPDMLKLSGDNRSITAMFSDIEKFSTISEHLGSSVRLFEFIKRYLTPMSDIILEELGTIDKYEGDAIIAFWNAPVDQDDHAVRACRAAMRMTHFEKKINQELINSGLLDNSILSRLPHNCLFTRIGLNTGINSVGFIGTEKRKDYTALGDEMNLAARLEGVNKIYDTQVLISDMTEKAIRGQFVTRHLDRIRVMGKDKPVVCYELCYYNELAEDYTDLKQKCFKLYNEGLKLYYDKRWEEAEVIFEKVLKELPEDGPSNVFLNRCRKYKRTPPPENWSGIYTMETK